MCGIVGFTGRKNTGILRNMCDSIIHRGPDEDGYYEDDEISLGMRRLAIVDLASGQQPVFNETNEIVAVFNGEIYDHLIHRKELQKKHRFLTHHSDSEVIVHGYEEYGEQWAAKVNGMVAIAIWDKKEQTLLLYRDRLGKKPLYYCECNGEIIFASEIKALLQHPAVSRELDYAALGNYFAMKNTSAPQTAYRAVKQLLPGQILKWEKGRIEISSFWQDNFSPYEDITPAEAAEEIRRLLENSVRLRMQCDVPFGAYLSGGVDSSAVAAFMSQECRQPIKTFCLGYKDKNGSQFWGKSQDIQYARLMAKRLGTEHYELIIDATEFAAAMPKIMKAFDEPFSGTISTFFLSALIRQHVTVALSGDGADELFASYLPQRLSYPVENYLKLRQNGKVDLVDMSLDERQMLYPFSDPKQFEFLKKNASSSLTEWREKLAVFSVDERKQLLNSTIFPPDSFVSAYKNLELNIDKGIQDILTQNLIIDQRELLPNQILPFVDRLSMAHSVEVRCPFLDYRLVEFVNRLPGYFKIQNGINKFILKKAVGDLLPADLLNRPKEGFVQPIYTWMHTSLKEWVCELLHSLPMEMFSNEYLDMVKSEYLAGNQNYNAKVWNLACFALWWNNREV